MSEKLENETRREVLLAAGSVAAGAVLLPLGHQRKPRETRASEKLARQAGYPPRSR
jgi:hypothetical protein